jgi:hypothetical protein
MYGRNFKSKIFTDITIPVKLFVTQILAMNKEDLYVILDEVIIRLYRNDPELLRDGLEWAISHRLAVYLESFFNGWSVDCEYTKMGHEFKTKHDSNAKYKRPDIVIHKRGLTSKENNLLVIEVKFRNNDGFDFGKLEEFTSKPYGARIFQYQYGLAISFQPELQLDWFENGREITNQSR